MPGHQHPFAHFAQTAMGATALQTGMAMLPAAAVGILISPISGVVFDKFGPRAISVGGLTLMTVALFALSRHGCKLLDRDGGGAVRRAGCRSVVGEHAGEHLGHQRA